MQRLVVDSITVLSSFRSVCDAFCHRCLRLLASARRSRAGRLYGPRGNNCERLGGEEIPPIEVGANGSAHGALCPPSSRAISVVSGGRSIQPLGKPHWSTTGDGIVVGIDFEVR